MILKSINPVTSIDGKDIKLTIQGQDGESVDVITSAEEFKNALHFLIEFSTTTDIAKAVPLDPKTESETPAAEHALLIAKNVDLVRWEAGASALQFQTTQGASFQLGLTPEMTEFLRQSLNSKLSQN